MKDLFHFEPTTVSPTENQNLVVFDECYTTASGLTKPRAVSLQIVSKMFHQEKPQSSKSRRIWQTRTVVPSKSDAPVYVTITQLFWSEMLLMDVETETQLAEAGVSVAAF